ncbi:hypothetical protein NY997_06430, partial [Escherichia coli]|nr:hypothetical protein [Escherichia coli]
NLFAPSLMTSMLARELITELIELHEKLKA